MKQEANANLLGPLLFRRRMAAPQGLGSAAASAVTQRYVVAVLILAVTVIACGAITTVAGLRQKFNAGIINMAGAQRMLSQRIAALVETAGLPEGDAARDQLMNAVTQMQRSHTALTSGLDAPARRTPELMAYYFAVPDPLDLQIAGFISHVRTLDAAIDTGQWTAEEAGRVRSDAFGLILTRLQTAVQLHEAAAISDAQSVLRIEWIVVCLTLIILGLEVLLIFRPLAKSVSELATSLESRGNTDELTGLLNRRAVASALRDLMDLRKHLAVIAIDLDWFKEINEAEGHAGGDAVLREVAQRLLVAVRQGDVVGRLGGDEFIVILAGLEDPNVAGDIGRRICAKLSEAVPFESRQLRVGATLGLAMYPTDANTAELAIRAADDALVRTKQEGRGGVGRATPIDTARIMREAVIMRKLREADLELPGLDAFFQPIMSLNADGGEMEIVAYEALARWHDPDVDDISPAEMFDAAQRVGRFTWLTAQVRSVALAHFAALRQDGLPAPRLALNISAAEVTQGGIVALLERDTARAGLTLPDLTLEITEDLLLERISDNALRELAVLRAQGARLALDDFGTGSSGLSHLLRLNLDEVKIDKTFIQGIANSPKAAEIIQATVALGRGLGFKVVGEGVETQAQFVQLQSLGCSVFQGYLFGRPMSNARLRQWLKARPVSVPRKPVTLRIV